MVHLDLITASPCYTTKRETETETDTETDRQRQTQRERDRATETHPETDKDRNRVEGGRETETETTQRARRGERQTDRQTDRKRERESYLHSLQSQERLAAVLNQVSRVGYELAEMITKGCGYDLVDVSLVAFHQRLYCLHAR